MNHSSKVASKWVKSVLLGLALVAAPLHSALATAILTTDRNAITGLVNSQNTFTNWGNAGAPDETTFNSTFMLGGLTISGADYFSILSGSTYNADFLPTDNILALYDLVGGSFSGGMFSITFSQGVQAAGAQIQANLFGPFSGTVSAYNISNILLGSYNVGGANGGNGGGSALFAGIISNSNDIVRLDFAGFGAGAGLGGLTSAVPEPDTLLIMMIGLGFIVLSRRFRLTHNKFEQQH